MTKVRKDLLGMMLFSCCFCLDVVAEEASLHELLARQESALKTLQQKLAGRNPYLQWRSAQEALESVTAIAGRIARTSRRIERERVEFADANQRLTADKVALAEEVQDLRGSNKALAEANEHLTKGRKQLLAQNEQFASELRLFWIALFSALALAFLGFGGLLVRIPNSRLERKLKLLRIAEMENRLKKEAASSRAGTSGTTTAARDMAQRRRRKSDMGGARAEPPSAEARAKYDEPAIFRNKREGMAPLEPRVAPEKAGGEQTMASGEGAAEQGDREDGARQKETQQKRKKKKKKQDK
ncbi:MAG: hypothetical protein QNK18_08865 [Gammaproteobacteria bacterium]|nr:hypothetical protein [Gammaproteobacteria bacterium]